MKIRLENKLKRMKVNFLRLMGDIEHRILIRLNAIPLECFSFPFNISLMKKLCNVDYTRRKVFWDSSLGYNCDSLCKVVILKMQKISTKAISTNIIFLLFRNFY